MRSGTASLGHDLNTEAVNSLKKDAASVNARAQELTNLLDNTVTTINTNADALRPQ